MFYKQPLLEIISIILCNWYNIIVKTNGLDGEFCLGMMFMGIEIEGPIVCILLGVI